MTLDRSRAKRPADETEQERKAEKPLGIWGIGFEGEQGPDTTTEGVVVDDEAPRVEGRTSKHMSGDDPVGDDDSEI